MNKLLFWALILHEWDKGGWIVDDFYNPLFFLYSLITDQTGIYWWSLQWEVK